MNDFSLNVRVGNIMLNKIMKRDYGYDYFFRINPIIYMTNRVLIPKKIHLLEMVYVKLNGTISFEEKEKLISSLYNRIKILENKLIVDLENQKKNLKKDVIAEVRILPTNETTYSFTFIKQIHNSDFRKMESAIYSGLAAERKFYDNI